MTTYNGWFNFFVSAVLLAPSLAIATGLSVQLTPKEIFPGNRARVEIRLDARDYPEIAKLETDPKLNDDLLSQTKDLILLEREHRKDGAVWLWTFEFTSHQIGKRTIPPVEIKWGPQSFSTEAQNLSIVSSRSQGDGEIRPEFGTMPLPIAWGRYLRLIVIGILTWYLAHWLRRVFPRHLFHRKKRLPPVVVVPAESDLEWLRKQLARIRMRLQSGDESEELVDELTGIVRTYYARRTHAPVFAWTTQEIQKFVREETVTQMQPMLERCDHFKFSGHAKPSPLAFVAECLQTTERVLLAC